MYEEEKTQLEQTLESGNEATVENSSEEQVQPQTPTDAGQNQNSHNIRQLREAKEKVQRERDELLRRLQAMEQQQAKPVEQDEDPSPNPDDLVEWRVVEKKLKKMEQRFQQYQQQSDLSATELRLKAQFSDFDAIVSKDNVEMLRELEPELFDSIYNNPNLYNKGAAAYKAIKKMALPQDTFGDDKERVLKNAGKPRPSNTVAPQSGESPLQKANAFGKGLTQEQKQQLWREMKEITGR